MPICVYSRRCQPEMMFTPNRPCEMLSMVTPMRAASGGGIVSTAQVAKRWMRCVTAASPAISVKDSRLCSQNCEGPPKPCSLIIDRAKSNPNRSAFSTMVRFRSNVGMYCGDVVLISQPLLPMGMKTPSCIIGPICKGKGATRSGGDELVPAPGQIPVLIHHRVPHCDVSEPLLDGAAVAH